LKQPKKQPQDPTSQESLLHFREVQFFEKRSFHHLRLMIGWIDCKT